MKQSKLDEYGALPGMSPLGLSEHRCEPGSTWWEYDAQGIELCRVCDHCRAEKLSHYRPEILSGYDQSDVDEPIESSS